MQEDGVVGLLIGAGFDQEKAKEWCGFLSELIDNTEEFGPPCWMFKRAPETEEEELAQSLELYNNMAKHMFSAYKMGFSSKKYKQVRDSYSDCIDDDDCFSNRAMNFIEDLMRKKIIELIKE